MTLTDFGKTVRKARIDTGETLLTMSSKLKTSPAFLSGIETGRKKIPNEWVVKIQVFFKSYGLNLENLEDQADVANKSVPIDGLDYQHQMLVAGFAKSDLSQEDLKKFAEMIKNYKRR